MLVPQLSSILKCWNPLVTSVRWKYPQAFLSLVNQVNESTFSVLKNQLTVVTETRPHDNHVTVGLFVEAGSRFESISENGITHFFEHLVFKSTHEQKTEVLEKSFANIGALFKSFTEREICGYYAECLPEDLSSVVHILSDCVFRNGFNESDFERQKKIIYQEMEKEDTNMNSVLFDYLHGAAFCGTSMSRSVLGSSCNLENFTPLTVSSYISKIMIPSRAALVAVGCVKHQTLLDLANRCQSCCAPPTSPSCFGYEYRFTAADFRYRDDSLPYSSVAFAWEAPGFGFGPCEFALEVARTLVGGWDGSQPGGLLIASPLAQAAHSGLSDGFKSFYIKYRDTGLWGCHMFSKRLTTEDWISAFSFEVMRLCTMVSESELERAKNELKTQMLIRYDDTSKACKDIARSMLYCQSWPTMDVQLRCVDSLTVEQFSEIMRLFIYDKSPALAAVGNIEQLLNYSRLRSGFYWLKY